MPIHYISFEEARERNSLSMVVVKNIPSPWCEGAKGILKVKNIKWDGVYFDPRNSELLRWTGVPHAPSLKTNDQEFIHDWKDILNFLEAHSTYPNLLPENKEDCAEVLKISELICGRNGLGWNRRLNNVYKSFTETDNVFPEFIAKYMAKKYGYERDQGPYYKDYVVETLNTLTKKLKSQEEQGSSFYVGNSITASDIYSATFMGMFKPLPEEVCEMDSMIRKVFSSLDEDIAQALDPILIKHRDFIYSKFLELPLCL